MKNFFGSFTSNQKNILWILVGVSALGFVLGFFSLLNSTMGITSGEAKQIPFIDNLVFALMFLAPVLSGAVVISALLLLFFRKR